MTFKNFMTIGSVATLLGICTKTLRRWDNSGKLKPDFRTLGNHRRYKRKKILSLLKNHGTGISDGKCSNKIKITRTAIYGRVSASRQKKSGDLARQLEAMKKYCASKNYQVLKCYSDVGSGLNDNRVGLLALLKAVSLGKYDMVVVNYNDRLARFGLRVIREFLSSWCVQLEVVNPTIVNNTPHAELITDLTSILYSFMGKLYRMRRK